MAKQKYLLQYRIGGIAESEVIEAGSMRAALNKSDNPDFGIISISRPQESAERMIKIGSDGSYTLSLPEGYFVAASLPGLNSVLQRLGYKSVRETSNMLNREAGTFLIDADTPSYCDPGSEAYHSM
jgi:hypothetical protein